jgi:hypothetical protein
MAYEQYTPEEMDANAKDAERELIVMGGEGTVSQLADWWRRWYLKAGHKRLARMLMMIK